MTIAERFKNVTAVMDFHVAQCGDPAVKLAWVILRRALSTPLTDLMREEVEAMLSPKETE